MYNNDMYKTFKDENIIYDYTFSFERQNKDYLVNYNNAKFGWDYGNTVSVVFKFVEPEDYDPNLVSSKYPPEIIIPTPEDGISGIFKVRFFNFRFEEIFEHEFVPNIDSEESSELTVNIDEETSKTVFKKGIYYCSVENVHIDHSKTLLAPENCILYVD